jgi:hypothetical protein
VETTSGLRSTGNITALFSGSGDIMAIDKMLNLLADWIETRKKEVESSSAI